MRVPRTPLVDLTGIEHEEDAHGLLLHPRDAEQAMAILDQLASARNRCFFRGMESKVWKVRSTLARHWESLSSPPPTGIVMHERRLLSSFAAEATDLIPSHEFALLRDQDAFRQVAMAQHFGLPTRLVDWTWSPQHAALFAVVRREIGWGVVWWVRLRAAVAAIRARCAALGKRRDAETRKWDYMDAFTLDAPKYLLLIIEKMPFPRMLAQHGLFTFTSDYFADHVETISEMIAAAGLVPSQHMGRLLIPYDWKGGVRDLLEERGIDAFTLDLNNLDLAVQRTLQRVDDLYGLPHPR